MTREGAGEVRGGTLAKSNSHQKPPYDLWFRNVKVQRFRCHASYPEGCTWIRKAWIGKQETGI